MSSSLRDVAGPESDRRPAEPSVVDWLRATVAEWDRRARDRHVLAHMSERQRRDIGLPHDVVEHEIGKPFWRA